jgi:hypothetical protein
MQVCLCRPGVSLHSRPLNYLKKQLGRMHKRPASEYGHRMVLWCMLGPPPPLVQPIPPPAVPRALFDPVVMHVCNRPSCQNALHMVWGERWENCHRRSYSYALKRWTEQWGRFIDV